MAPVRTVAIWVAGIAAWIGFVALGAAARDAGGPWQWAFLALIIPIHAWITFKKLTSDHQVDTTFYGHLLFTLVAVASLLYGLLLLIEWDDALGQWTSTVGLLSLIAGIVMFAAELRDSMNTSAAVEEDPEDAAGPVRAADQPPRRRAW